MIEYTIENNECLKGAFNKGKEAAPKKHQKWGMDLNLYHVKDNPYIRTGSFGKKLKAAWHNGFVSVRNKDK